MDLELLKHLEGFLSERRIRRFQEVLAMRTRHITVAVEDVFQLHNASAVIRSCEVFGIQDAHLIEARFGQRLDKNIALGAQQWVDVHRYTDTRACLTALRQKGYKIVATSPHVEGVSIEGIPLEQPLALFFGTEKEGLSETVLKDADYSIHIPMVGFTESLNVSVAAAIILFRLSSRLRETDISWGLSEAEILEKRLDWTRKTIKSADEIIARFKETS
jgi:tRNA (guanosine-2'-O-)-methyltransferase